MAGSVASRETSPRAAARFPRATLPEEIAHRILDLIRTHELRPGDKLPAERELAHLMGVSRPVLREALRALALMRMVDIRHGDGTYVTALEPRQLVAHLDVVFSTDVVAIGMLLEARRVVETGSARLAATRVTDEEVTRLEALVADLAAAVDEPDRFAELDITFHDTICSASRNALLGQVMRVLSTMGRVSRQRTGALREVRVTAHHDHVAILAALRTRDPDAAEAAMRAHLDHVAAALRAEAPDEAAPERDAVAGPSAFAAAPRAPAR